jgi:hypothetical protein
MEYIYGRQVADLSQMKGLFKFAFTKYKWLLLASLTGRACQFIQTDIMPLIK